MGSSDPSSEAVRPRNEGSPIGSFSCSAKSRKMEIKKAN